MTTCHLTFVSGQENIFRNQQRIVYYIKLVGFITENKQLEFEQTYKFACMHMPGTCAGYDLSKDFRDAEVYHFISYWQVSEALLSFKRSAAYYMLIGAFRTLGNLRENSTGEISEILSKN